MDGRTFLDSEPVTQAVFHPRPEPNGYAPDGTPTATASHGAQIAGYLHLSEASDVLLLFFHGNGETAADYDSLASLYTDCGVSFWITDYRGYGRSTGTPSFSAMLRDAEAVLADVPRVAAVLDRQFARTIVMGRSLGSAPAIHVAATQPEFVKGLILDSPYANGPALVARLGGPSVARERLTDLDDNLDRMRRCRLPTLVIHGTNDQIIPLADAETLFDACPGNPKRLLKVRGAGHNNLLLVGFSDYCRQLNDFVAGIVGRTTPST